MCAFSEKLFDSCDLIVCEVGEEGNEKDRYGEEEEEEGEEESHGSLVVGERREGKMEPVGGELEDAYRECGGTPVLL